MASFRRAAIVSVIVLGAGMSLLAWASYSPWVGNGDPNNPYRIARVEQLIAINGSDKCFVLASSLDMAGRRWSGPPIASFSGTLDGNSCTISNLTILGMGDQALFGQLKAGAGIRNLGLTHLAVAGTGSAAGLAVQNAGKVMNCFSTGAVTGGTSAGGLIASNTGVVMNSYSEAEVTGTGLVGGLVGSNAGMLSNCRSSGNVLCLGESGGESSSFIRSPHVGYMAGGLAGENSGTIAASYSTSAVLAEGCVGGLVGYNSAGISLCYSTGAALGAYEVGGLVGYSSKQLRSCYSIATVIGPDKGCGGLVGVSAEAPKNCYALAPADGGGPDNKVGTFLTAKQMEDNARYVGWDFWGTNADGSDDRWFMPPHAFAVLAWQTEITGLVPVPDVVSMPADQAKAALAEAELTGEVIGQDYHRTVPSGSVVDSSPRFVVPPGGKVGLILSAGKMYDWTGNAGQGMLANPYCIQTPGQLESLGDNPQLWDKYFVVTADLDMVGRVYSTALIAPDVNSVKSGFQGTAFTGSLNGDGHTVRNFQIAGATVGYLGLFGNVGASGQVSGLAMKNASIQGRWDYVGTLAGHSEGTVVSCSATGEVSAGCNSVDGLIGSNHGAVIDCNIDVTVIRNCGSTRGS